MAVPLKLVRARIENFRSLKDVDLEFGNGSAPADLRKMTVLIGENGSGKSSVLRAIAIGMCPQREASGLISHLSGSVIRKNKQGNMANQARIVLSLCDPKQPDCVFEIETKVIQDTSGQEQVVQTHSPESFPWDRIFVCGYGVNRGSTFYEPVSSYRQQEAVETMFNENARLLDPEGELRRLKLASLDPKTAGDFQAKYEMTLKVLKKVLRIKPSYEIEVSSTEVLVHGPWAPMPFHALGDGYRGTAGWVLDLLGRFGLGKFTVAGDSPSGIVLIDEVDEHLHPEWQKEIATLLQKWFPGIQFICTTHSPMTIVNCKAGEVYTCSLRNAVGKVEVAASPEGKNADDILKGEWFGLKSTMDKQSERLLQDYLKAVKGSDKNQMDKIQGQLRERLGYLVTTPLEEAALRLVHEARAEVQDMSKEERKTALMSAFEAW